MAGCPKFNAEMIEVDPKLFITCRLCLEEMGIYQIVPTVQQQIKYCFDINVEPFDGLPQLLCKQCKILLDEYSANKKKFVDKQESLISKLKVRKEDDSLLEPRIDSVGKRIDSPDNASEGEVNSSRLKPIKIRKIRRNRLISNSSTDSASVNEIVKTKKKTRKQNKQSTKWKKKYHKKFVCNFCSKLHKEKKNLMNHLLEVHSQVRSKYQYVFDKPCSVNLIKYDDKLNSTGVSDTIMLDQDKIIQFDGGNSLYHVLYIARNKESKTNSMEDQSLKRACSESSGDDFLIARKKSKANRLFSRSSNETVLIDGKDNIASKKSGKDWKEEIKENQPIENLNNTVESKLPECINIDDSSDSNTENNIFNDSTKPPEASIEYKTIENIISVCRNKYLRKLELSQNEINQPSKKLINSESQLKHKVLSIGRKILKKGGNFTGTGLLRYLEHKNLDISWLPKLPLSDSKEDLVRIMTKIKFTNQEDACDDNGWRDVPEEERGKPIFIATSKRADVSDSAELTINKASLSSVVPSAITSKAYSSATSSDLPNAIPTSMNCAVLYTVDPEMNSTKILNQSPVANPKQLPKKLNLNDTKTILVTKSKIDKVNNKSIIIDLDDEQNNETNIMPVITSTTSLAKVTEGKKEEISGNSDVNKVPEKSVPRIKVKPASELMKPQNIIQTNQNQNGSWAVNNFESLTTPNISIGNVYIQGLAMPQIQNVHSIQFVPEQSPLPIQSTPEAVTNTEYLVLDTVELPNTKTDSPFKYFKKLLLLHKIFLLDPNNDAMTQDYICLLKIKVQFKDAYKQKPVTLCLSLFNCLNSFCICIKDSNRIDINMTKISAMWQWEVFKVFQGDISNKILYNSFKASSEAHLNTKSFLCLLKSINCRQ